MADGEAPYDLEERTFRFAQRTRGFVKTLPRTICNLSDVRQLVRSSGAVGANYIEANENLSKKDCLMRMKISRKETKESIFWLRLLEAGAEDEDERKILVQEATELLHILSSIIQKLERGSPPP